MPAPMTLLKVDPPAVIRFKADRRDKASTMCVITLENPGSEPVAFKVKTTAPDAFGLRPSAGSVPPGGNQEVQVILQLKGIEKAHNSRFQIQAARHDQSVAAANESWAIWAKEAGRVQEHLLNVLCTIVGAPASPSDAPAAKGSSPDKPQKVKTEDLQTYARVLEKEVRGMQEHVLRLKQCAELLPETKKRAVAVAAAVFVLSRLLRYRARHGGNLGVLCVSLRDGVLAAAATLAFALGQQRKLRAGGGP